MEYWKYILILLLMILFTSCGVTHQENLNKIEECKELWLLYHTDIYGEIVCNRYKEDKVMDCIKEYTNWIYEKYDNPDYVNNLREDKYSQVVTICNKTFGENNK